MTLDKNEMAIIAGFRTIDQAEKAKQELDQLGVIDQRIDRMGLYPVTENERHTEHAITGDYPGLANGVFNTSMDRDSSVLASVQPSASGMSDGNPYEAGVDVVLTVVVSKEKFDQAEQIVRELGGQF